MKHQKWDMKSLGPISTEAIRLLHQPANLYRVSWNKYPPKTEFVGQTFLEECLYVLRGRCKITIAGSSCSLAAGEYADLPSGEYRFSVVGEGEAEIVSVWEIPERYRQRDSESQGAT